MIDEAFRRDVDELVAEVKVLRAESAARKLLGRYMFLCDAPLPEYQLSELQRAGAIAELFADDAVWEGVGGAHGAQFGRKVGPAAIAEHMTALLRRPKSALGLQHPLPVYRMLGRDIGDRRRDVGAVPAVDLRRRAARCCDPAVYTFGSATLPDGWRIAHYRTESLFIADLPDGWTTSLISQSVLWTDRRRRL